MKITYTGRQMELAPAQWKKIEMRAAKLGKFVDGKGEREAHVTVSLERGRHSAEITVNYPDHPLVGEASNQDLFKAMFSAIEKLERQAVKVIGKTRDTKRTAPKPSAEPVAAAPKSTAGKNGAKRIYRVNNNQDRKPMTVDEAILEMEKDRDYLVYRDAGNDRLSILMRRRDGNFDLVEC